MVSFRCGCIIERTDTTFSYCPICGKYLRNSFLGEPSPQLSAIREIVKNIYDEKKIAGSFLEIRGTTTWEGIADPIKKADICFFDISGIQTMGQSSGSQQRGATQRPRPAGADKRLHSSGRSPA